MLNVTHNTTDYEINNASRDELKSALMSFGQAAGEINKLNKAERVELTKTYRDRLAKAHAEAEAIRERDRQIEVEQDSKDQNFVAVKVAYLELVKTQVADAEAQIKKLQTRIAEGDLSEVVYTMRHYLDDVLKAEAKRRAHLATCEYLQNQVDEPTHTKEEFVKYMDQHVDSLINGVLSRTDYRSNSSSQVSNMESQIDFETRQETARFYRNAAQFVKADLESGETNADAMKVRYTRG